MSAAMTHETVYDNICQSVVKFCMVFLAAEGLGAPQYIDWDAHAQINELPAQATLIGPAGIGMSHEHDFIEVVFGIGVCTEDDVNLFRLRSLISKLYGRLKPETRITLYNHSTALAVSWMVTTTPVAITPVTKAETRSLQFIEVRALIDPAAASSL